MEDVAARPMFGGWGLYCGPVFFGIVHDDRFYLKTDAQSRVDYIRRGSGPFEPNPRQTLKSYYEVPAEILESVEDLGVWARRAVQAQSQA